MVWMANGVLGRVLLLALGPDRVDLIMAGCSDLPVGWERLSPVHMVRWAKSVMSKHRHASVAMADFISNSAILAAIRPSSVLTQATGPAPRCEKWQSLRQSLPSLDYRYGLLQ